MSKHFYRLQIGGALLYFFLCGGCIMKEELKTSNVQAPNLARFDSTVAAPALRDSLRQNKLLPGMPYFVVAQLFAAWDDGAKKIPVVSVGRRQPLQLDRDLNALHTQIFLDEYETPQGKLSLWYQFPDFYRMNVSAGDTLFIFGPNQVRHSTIAYLLDRFRLKVKNPLSNLSAGQPVYGEIHHYDEADRQSSYWYALMPEADGMTFTLESTDFELYPIERLELDGKLITSFQWK
jgi:hypothetical protein